MPTKIRLQRFGKKAHAYYHIVVADSRAPRDGKYIERIGSYDPNTNPATIEVNRDKAVEWLGKGAQPTDTARAILSYRGVLYKHHLLRGVDKGVLTLEQAEAKLVEWDADKTSKIVVKSESVNKSKQEVQSKRHEAESLVRETIAKAIKEKLAAAAVGEEAESNSPAEEPVDESDPIAPPPEAPAEEAPKAEASAPEAPAKEEPKAEAPAPEAPAKEEPKAEAPAPEAPAKVEPKAEAPAPEASAKEEPKAEAPAKEESKAEGGDATKSDENK